MHFESTAEMSKGYSSYKDLHWHVKTSNSKDSIPTQSSLLSSLQSCTQSIVGLRNCWPWMSTEWAAECLKGKSHLWEQAVSHSHSQNLSGSASWAPAPPQHSWGTAGDTGCSSSSSHGQHAGQQKYKNTKSGSDRHPPDSKVLNSADNLFIVSSCGRSPVLLAGF